MIGRERLQTGAAVRGWSITTLKRGLLLAWALWFGIVFLTNACDALKALGVLSHDWSFASGNYDFIAKTTAIYHLPAWADGVLFGGVIVWEGACTLLFVRAFLVTGQKWGVAGPVLDAFVASTALWVAFILADEIFVAYQIEATHREIFTSLLATLIALVILPD